MTNLIEQSFALTTHLLKKDLRKARAREPVVGYLNILYNNKPSILDYRVEFDDEGTCLLIVYFGQEPQRILLYEHELTFGTRTYLTCKCGCKTNALYLNNGVFACRKCQNLKYQSTTINPSSKHGKFLRQQNQILKIISMREDMTRIFYRSKYSKRFIRWLELCGRAGLTDEVASAQELMRDINSFQQV